jgi:hypothetical protein
MEIYINAERAQLDVADLLNFGQLIQKIETDVLGPRGEVLTQIQLNDRDLDEAAELDHQNLPLSRIQKLIIKSTTPTMLVLEALGDAPTILSEMVKVLDEVLGSFEDSQDSKGYQEFVIVTDGLSWFTTIYSRSMAIFQDLILQQDLHQSPFILESQKLSKTIEEILDCQSSKDRTTFLDLLEYELKPSLEVLSREVVTFREALVSNP